METENSDGSGSSSFNSNSNQFSAGLHVLVVDDDRVFLKTIEKLLLDCNYEVTTTNEAAKAIQMLKENREKYGLVLSDVQMPDIDGFKLLELVGLEMDIPIILVSEDDNPKLIGKGIEHGAVEYLLKPLTHRDVKNMWKHVTRRMKLNEGERDKASNGAAVSENRNNETNRKCKDLDENGEESKNNKENEDINEQNEPGNDERQPLKKRRLVWTAKLHNKFAEIYYRLGDQRAVPKEILRLMNEPGLTRENVASHLQKFRMYIKQTNKQASVRQSWVTPSATADPSGASTIPYVGDGHILMERQENIPGAPVTRYLPGNTISGYYPVQRRELFPGMIQQGCFPTMNSSNSVGNTLQSRLLTSFNQQQGMFTHDVSRPLIPNASTSLPYSQNWRESPIQYSDRALSLLQHHQQASKNLKFPNLNFLDQNHSENFQVAAQSQSSSTNSLLLNAVICNNVLPRISGMDNISNNGNCRTDFSHPNALLTNMQGQEGLVRNAAYDLNYTPIRSWEDNRVSYHSGLHSSSSSMSNVVLGNNGDALGPFTQGTGRREIPDVSLNGQMNGGHLSTSEQDEDNTAMDPILHSNQDDIFEQTNSLNVLGF